ncbi:MAG TPA: arginine deiminase-related protein [Rudaea sp.]|nr:arginine deiminase-related protein [Rudaea sp.]
MIVTSAAEFLSVYSAERFPATAPATARAAFLVAPSDFSLAAESASDNRYMAMDSAVDPLRAASEHARLAAALRESVPTLVFPGDPAMPDGVFPNNVFATVAGRAIVGAMRHGVRRREAARADIRAFFRDLLHYELVDLSTDPVVAELTGALVIDRARGIGFCGLSERCDRAGAEAMHRAFGLKLTFCFELAPGEYHANVVLAQLASRAVIIAPDGFADHAAAEAIAQVYAPRVLRIDAAQKAAFAGNAIALDAGRVWMSTAAAAALTQAQRDALGEWGFALRSVPLEEIEKAGGSLRCCVGEIF